MAIKSYFYNAIKKDDGTFDRVYNAEDLTTYLELLIGDGVFVNPSTNMQVVENNGMNIIVKEGSGWIKGHKIKNTADLILNVDSADVLLNRVDRVVFACDYANREMSIYIKKGENAQNPIAPELQRDSSKYEMSLAEIMIAKQAKAIYQQNIRDTRSNSDVCGWVAGLITQLDTCTLFNQWTSAFDNTIKITEKEFNDLLSEFETQKNDTINQFNQNATKQLSDNQTAFDTWFNTVKNNLVVPKLTEYRSIYNTTQENESIIDINIPSYVVENDLIYVYVNGFKMTNEEFTNTQTQVTLKKPLTVIGTQVEIIIIKSTVLTA